MEVNRENIVFIKKDFPLDVTYSKKASHMPVSFWHEEIEIKYVTDGNIAIMTDTEVITAEKGDIIFINPYEIHSNVNIENEDGTYDLIMLGLDFFEEINAVDLRKVMLKKRIKHIIENAHAKSIVERILEEYRNDDEYVRMAIDGLVREFFAVILRYEVDQTDTSGSVEERIKYYRLVEPAVEKLRNEYASTFSGNELAGFCRLNRYHFCRIFKLAMGMTPVQYQNECRIKIADVLIDKGDLTIAEIAHKVGFEDVAYFSRTYKKYRGISPNKQKSILSK